MPLNKETKPSQNCTKVLTLVLNNPQGLICHYTKKPKKLIVVILSLNTFLEFQGLVWFGLVLWHIDHCRLFNAQFFLYIYIKNMISKHILWIIFLNETGFIFLHTVKWFHLFLSNTNNSIYC